MKIEQKSKESKTKKFKLHPKLKKAFTYISFYARQSLKAAFIMIAFYMPVDMLNNYIYSLKLSLANMSNADYIVATGRMNYFSIIAGTLFVAGILIAIFKVEWSKHKYDYKKMKKAQEKEELNKFNAHYDAKKD